MDLGPTHRLLQSRDYLGRGELQSSNCIIPGPWAWIRLAWEAKPKTTSFPRTPQTWEKSLDSRRSSYHRGSTRGSWTLPLPFSVLLTVGSDSSSELDS